MNPILILTLLRIAAAALILVALIGVCLRSLITLNPVTSLLCVGLSVTTYRFMLAPSARRLKELATSL